MTFEEFVREAETNILDYLPKEINEKTHEVRINKVRKNQDQIFHGLSILPRQSDGTALSPSIYLEGFYEEYKDGEPFPCILREIAEMYLNAVRNTSQIGDIPKLLSDYNWVKTRFQIRACDTKMNQERIKDIMHITQGPITGLVYVVVDDDPGHFSSTPVTKQLFEMWGVTKDQLIQDVMESNKNFGVLLYRFAEILYRLTNKVKLNGAGLIFNKDVMDNIHDEIGDFYILPSSIHECMLVPFSAGLSYDELKAMVRDANTLIVEDANILSYEVMEYRK